MTKLMLTNIRSIRQSGNFGQLCIQIEEHQRDLLAVNETWLNDSTESLNLPGYRSTARRDRRGSIKKRGGGVDVYSKNTVRNIGLIEESKVAERTWSTLHTDIGPILIGNWYRPGDEDLDVEAFQEEAQKHSNGMIGTIIVGDLNVHHKKWLRYSSGNTTEGEQLMQTCADLGLRQIVREPTRGPHLLDLLITDLDDLVTATILPTIADHHSIMCQLDIGTQKVTQIERIVWDFHQADWEGLNNALGSINWYDAVSGTNSEAT